MRFQTTLFRVAEVADQLWLNGVEVNGKHFNATLQQLTLETKIDYVVLENQRVEIEFGAFKALTLQGTSRNFQAQMTRHIAKKDLP